MKGKPNPRLYTREQARRIAARYARMKTAATEKQLKYAENLIRRMTGIAEKALETLYVKV
jgi:hypothetical protein